MHIFINEGQHGFIKGKSTATNLCEYTQLLSDNLENKLQTDVIYTDLSKAFDVVDHRILLRKLQSYGLCDSLILFLNSLLTARFQYVEYLGYKSKPFQTCSGVVQGSNLGPLLFLSFFNDVFSIFKSHVLVYADDLKIVRCIKSVEDCTAMQNDLEQFSLWCAENKMNLNIVKCKIISFCRI